eukprot:3866419-Rhodomonas_salina.2
MPKLIRPCVTAACNTYTYIPGSQVSVTALRPIVSCAVRELGTRVLPEYPGSHVLVAVLRHGSHVLRHVLWIAPYSF